MLKKLLPTLALLALVAGLTAILVYAQPETRDDPAQPAPQAAKIASVPYPADDGICPNLLAAAERLRRIPSDSLARDALVAEMKPLNDLFRQIESNKSKASQLETDYITLYFQKELKRIAKDQTAQSERESVRNAWDDLKFTVGTLDKLSAADKANVGVLRLVCEDIRARIATLVATPFERRLKHLEIAADEYKKNLGAIMDAFARYYEIHRDYENRYISTNPAPGAPAQPRKTPAAEKDTTIYEHSRQFVLVTAAIQCYGNPRIAEVKGDVTLRQPAASGEASADKWIAPTVGAELDAFDLLQTPAGKTARIVFEDGRVAELAPATVVVPWEIAFTLTKEKTAEINALINELGAEDLSARGEAERKLTQMGRIALAPMRAALQAADMERAFRLRRIIYAISEQYLS